jgi:bifunctional non-homologous end joining protein LigD
VRHTHGITFYHKGPLPPIPARVHQLQIEKREGGEGVRVWVDDLDGLLGLVEMDAVELHPWAESVDDIDHPDRLVFDLDPGPGIEWAFVTESALQLRAVLEAEGYESWPKLTGGKGVHLMVRIEPSISHDEARVYCRGIAEGIARTAPERYATSPDPKQRTNRIYIDDLRNGRGNTAIGAYSPRAQAGFPIAAPAPGANSNVAFCRMRSPSQASRLCRARGVAKGESVAPLRVGFDSESALRVTTSMLRPAPQKTAELASESALYWK